MLTDNTSGGLTGGILATHKPNHPDCPSLDSAATPQPTGPHHQSSQSLISSTPNSSKMTAATTILPGASGPHHFESANVPPGSQNQKRPIGLNLTNTNNHGLSHYPVSAPSSSAPLPPGPPNQSPIALLQRNASFSFTSSLPPNYQTLASAPPSATIPSSHPPSSMSGLNSLAQPNRGRLPLLSNASSASCNVRSEIQSAGPDAPSFNLPAAARPSTSTALSPSMPNGKTVPRDDSVLPPPSLNNFPGLGFAIPPSATSQTKTGHQTSMGPSCLEREAARFFNTYVYDYLLKQKLFEAARAFVTSGAELDLEGRDALLGLQPGSKQNTSTLNSTAHKRRRSEGSINPLNSSPQANSNAYCANDSANSTASKGGHAASELLPSERSMSSSGSTISSTSHYGFNCTDSSRSSNETPGSQGPNSDPSTNPSTVNGANGVGSSSRTSTSPQSSPADSPLHIHNLPRPKLALDTESGFLFEWWSIFWEVFRAKTGRSSAQLRPAQTYAQSVALPTVPSTDAISPSKARRDALGIIAVPNPLDLQKGTFPDRIHHQYTLVNPASYAAFQQESLNSAGPRPGSHSHLATKQALLVEHAARQQQLSRMQHQQPHIPRTEAAIARQRQQQQQTQVQQQQAQAQQQQQELQHRIQEAQLRQSHPQPQHMHQMHPAPHEQYMQQRPMCVNVRRPGMFVNVGADQAHSMMMPPPATQQGSPLNPHQQVYRPSRPPSRSGAAHAPSPFASGQPQRQPSRASNHAGSPAMQAHPRTPSASHASTPQPSVSLAHNRGSPAVSQGEQERKKRRLNEPVYNASDASQIESSNMPSSAQPPHSLTPQQQQQQMLAQHQLIQQQQQHQMTQQRQQQLGMPQQLRVEQHYQQQLNQQNQQQQQQVTLMQQQQPTQMQPPRRHMLHNPEFAGSSPDPSPINMNVDAYKQSIHAQHSQAMSISGGSNAQKEAKSPSPNKESANKSDKSSMPPPTSRNVATQPSTPQSSAGANKTTESTPMSAMVAPSPNLNPPARPPSRNDQTHLSGNPSGSLNPTTDLRSARMPSDQAVAGKSSPNNNETKANTATSEIQSANLPVDSSATADNQNATTLFSSEPGSKPHDKSDSLWDLESYRPGQHQPNASSGAGVSSDMPSSANHASTQNLTSDELNTVNTNAMDQLFSGDAMNFDIDATLFDAWINYDL